MSYIHESSTGNQKTRESATGTHILEVIAVGCENDVPSTRITVTILRTSADPDVLQPIIHSLCTSRRQPKLRTGMIEPKASSRIPWDRIVGMSDSVMSTRLTIDKVDESFIANTRAAVRVNITGVAGLSQVGCSNCCDCPSERVTGEDDLVRGVCGFGILDGSHGTGRHIPPCVEETLVEFTA